jgi:20S proteasome alpha/beta subunit
MCGMTIALGFTCNDGILVCADTEETVGSYVKTYDGKVDLHLFANPRVALIIAGAGSADYIRTATDCLSDDFPDEIATPKQLKGYLGEKLLAFFNRHLEPWASFPESERPSVELLIGATAKNFGPVLLHYDGTAVYAAHDIAIGAGVILANDLIGRYCFGNFTINQKASLALYVMSRVKRGVAGCGGHTHLMALRKGMDFALTEDKEIRQLEDRFAELEKEADRGLATSIIQSPLGFSWQSEWSHRKKAKERKENEKAKDEQQIPHP